MIYQKNVSNSTNEASSLSVFRSLQKAELTTTGGTLKVDMSRTEIRGNVYRQRCSGIWGGKCSNLEEFFCQNTATWDESKTCFWFPRLSRQVWSDNVCVWTTTTENWEAVRRSLPSALRTLLSGLNIILYSLSLNKVGKLGKHFINYEFSAGWGDTDVSSRLVPF